MQAKRSQPFFENQVGVRIVIADDHAVVRSGLKGMLACEAGFLVVGEAEDGGSAVTQTAKLLPDILLLDLHMPQSVGLNVVQTAIREAPRVKVILLTATITPSQILEAVEVGVRGIVEKTLLAENLATVIRTVFAGDYWFDGRPFSNLIEAHCVLTRKLSVANTQPYGLTPRELSALHCIGEGCSNKDIAKELVISEETVKRHLTNIFEKTGVSTRLELALFAIAHNLVVVEAL